MGWEQSRQSKEHRFTRKPHNIAQVLKKTEIDKTPKVDENYTLYLPLDEKKDQVMKFFRDSQHLTMGEIRKLSIFGLEFLPKENGIELFNKWLKHVGPHTLNTLYLHGYRIELARIKEGITPIIRGTQSKITLDYFKLSQEMLKLILENCVNCNELTLEDWQIEELNDNFKLDPNIYYSFTEFNLFGTCNIQDQAKLTDWKFIRLVKAMAKTNLKNSLKKVYVNEEEFPEDKIRGILDDAGFRCKIISE